MAMPIDNRTSPLTRDGLNKLVEQFKSPTSEAEDSIGQVEVDKLLNRPPSQFTKDARAAFARLRGLPSPVGNISRTCSDIESGFKHGAAVGPLTVGGARRSPQSHQTFNRMWDRKAASLATLEFHGILVSQSPAEKKQDYLLEEVPKSGHLNVTVLVTPSAHVGYSEADKEANYKLFGETNTYEIEVRYGDGEVIRLNALRHAPQGEFEGALAWDLQIPLKNAPITISAWPTATSADGSPDGRIMEVDWVDDVADCDAQ